MFNNSASGSICIVLEKMDYTLSDYIERTGKLNEAEAMHIFEQMARGINYMQSQGVVHCDLKPANILINLDDNMNVT